MARETAEVPETIARQIDTQMGTYVETGRRIARMNAPCLVTCARGTSDHAATYFKYLVEIGIGMPVSSIGPSVASIYRAELKMAGIPIIAISQSGASADLVATIEAAAAGGARTFVLTNNAGSPLAQAADHVLDQAAGQERSIAATKTFIASLVALASIYAAWRDDTTMLDAIRMLPKALENALSTDWGSALPDFRPLRNFYIISRGPSYAIACETALKFKETCRLHAEAFSAAEVRHGPIELADESFTTLAFLSRDESRHSLLDTVARMRETGAKVHVAGAGSEADLRTIAADHPQLDPICQILSLYGFVESLSRALGLDPDAPANLNKVTVTQ